MMALVGTTTEIYGAIKIAQPRIVARIVSGFGKKYYLKPPQNTPVTRPTVTQLGSPIDQRRR
jgi:hypothetical protein